MSNSVSDYKASFQIIEDVVVELVNFLQVLYLLHLASVMFSIWQNMFAKKDENNSKFGVHLVTSDGRNRHILQLDQNLLKAADLATSYILFYMLPPWISLFVFYIIVRVCIRGVVLLPVQFLMKMDNHRNTN